MRGMYEVLHSMNAMELARYISRSMISYFNTEACKWALVGHAAKMYAGGQISAEQLADLTFRMTDRNFDPSR